MINQLICGTAGKTGGYITKRIQMPTHIMIVPPLYAWTSWHDFKHFWSPLITCTSST